MAREDASDPKGGEPRSEGGFNGQCREEGVECPNRDQWPNDDQQDDEQNDAQDEKGIATVGTERGLDGIDFLHFVFLICGASLN